jgi:hypothetical protein
MDPSHNVRTYGAGAFDYCPECNHAWALEGSAHFTDCHYFSLDNDRDEESFTRPGITEGDMAIGDARKAAA